MGIKLQIQTSALYFRCQEPGLQDQLDGLEIIPFGREGDKIRGRLFSHIVASVVIILTAQIPPCENALHIMYHESQRHTRDRDVAERLQCPSQQDLNSKRKKTSLQPPKPKTNVNLWEIKPPDFSYKLYTSLRFPEKPSRTIKEESRRKTSNFSEIMFHLPSIRNPPKKAVSPKFITTFPCLDSHKAKLMFVKSGKYPRGVYLNPKPHDFRQYQPDLPNFVTTHERDPFGLKFKSQLLNTVHGSQFLKDDKQKNTAERFITYKPRECTWDSKLILAKAPWPIKSASYTRHRRRRDVYSAFMDRVEEKFMKTCKSRWAKNLGFVVEYLH
ncbi:LOW QUALITY PROTEIN: uncharacterized protein LOC134380944 [Cynocephalus volans]|uniref:LOW QUALITY PROTEIN: uncharacterized protein LOC134380944 n=1 Tax=Cynocephalus volans TaxID=110931 RepID=UPI002FC676B4